MSELGEDGEENGMELSLPHCCHELLLLKGNISHEPKRCPVTQYLF